MYIKCYHPPVNVSHLSDEIFVPNEDVYKYTKELYEKGRQAKSILPIEESEVLEYFKWKTNFSRLGYVRRWIINKLIK